MRWDFLRTKIISVGYRLCPMSDISATRLRIASWSVTIRYHRVSEQLHSLQNYLVDTIPKSLLV